MGKPLISVIIPYWNAGKYIRRCALSLTRQKGDFEFIFVNDKSSDGSLAELLNVKDSRIVTVENLGRKGVSAARNVGVSEASGEWITFLDADDEMLPEAYKVFEAMISKGADINQANHLRRYVKTNVTRQMYDNPSGCYKAEALPELWVGVWNKLYRREVLEGVWFDEDMQYGEDELFNLEAIDKARAVQCWSGRTVQHNIENEKSLSHVRTGEDMLIQLQKLEEFMKTHEDSAIRKVAYGMLTLHVNASWYFENICGE